MSGADPAAEPEPVTGGTADGAISALYPSHWLTMLRLVTLLIDDRGIAEEIVQDAFGALYRRWDSARPRHPRSRRSCIPCRAPAGPPRHR